MKKLFSCPPIHLSIPRPLVFTLAPSIVSSNGDEFEISTFFEDLELGFGAHGAACLLPACLRLLRLCFARRFIATDSDRLSGKRPFCLHLLCFSFARNILVLFWKTVSLLLLRPTGGCALREQVSVPNKDLTPRKDWTPLKTEAYWWEATISFC